MRKKRVLTAIFCFALAVVFCVGMTACGGSDDQASDKDQAQAEQEEMEEQDEREVDPELEQKEEAMIEAEENAEESPILRDKKYEDFVGKWVTATDLADDVFGGYKITFHEDKTFDAIITGEEETGKCTFEDGITTAHNEVVNDQFWFNEDEILVVRSEGGAMAMLKKIK